MKKNYTFKKFILFVIMWFLNFRFELKIVTSYLKIFTSMIISQMILILKKIYRMHMIYKKRYKIFKI